MPAPAQEWASGRGGALLRLSWWPLEGGSQPYVKRRNILYCDLDEKNIYVTRHTLNEAQNSFKVLNFTHKTE